MLLAVSNYKQCCFRLAAVFSLIFPLFKVKKSPFSVKLATRDALVSFHLSRISVIIWPLLVKHTGVCFCSHASTQFLGVGSRI